MPYPVEFEVDDPAPASVTATRLTDGPDVARDGVGRDRRTRRPSRRIASLGGGAAVTASTRRLRSATTSTG